jgi:hypothetical protein
MKQRNPNWGCPRIAQQIALAFHIQIDKDVVRRILGHHYRPGLDFSTYFNNHRTHTLREWRTRDTPVSRPIANLRSFGW